MPSYEIDKKNNTIKFEGERFDLQKIKDLLKESGASLYETIACPGEVKFKLSKEALTVLRNLKEKN